MQYVSKFWPRNKLNLGNCQGLDITCAKSTSVTDVQGRNEGGQFPGRQITAWDAENSQQCHYLLQQHISSERP